MTPPDDATDLRVVEAQIGRAPRGAIRVARRCHFALPVVLEAAPLLPGGEPFPTLYWLSCRLAHRRIARLEERGGVRSMDLRAAEDAEFRAELAEAEARYAARRAEKLGGAQLPDVRAFRGGIGGAIGGTKCLHAHFAHHLGDGPSPVGAAIESEVLPLECERPCVEIGADGGVHRNPAWVEPRRADTGPAPDPDAAPGDLG